MSFRVYQTFGFVIWISASAISCDSLNGSPASPGSAGQPSAGLSGTNRTAVGDEPVPTTPPTLGQVVGSGTPSSPSLPPTEGSLPPTVGSSAPPPGIASNPTPAPPLPSEPVPVPPATPSPTISTTTTSTHTTTTTTTTTTKTTGYISLSTTSTTSAPQTYCGVQYLLTYVLGANGQNGVVVDPDGLQSALFGCGGFSSQTIATLISSMGHGPLCQNLLGSLITLTPAQTYTLWETLADNDELYITPSQCPNLAPTPILISGEPQWNCSDSAAPMLPALPVAITTTSTASPTTPTPVSPLPYYVY